MTTEEKVADLKAQLSTIASRHPAEAVLAIMDALIDVVCFDEIFQRVSDTKRMWLYTGVLKKLAAKGITP